MRFQNKTQQIGRYISQAILSSIIIITFLATYGRIYPVSMPVDAQGIARFEAISSPMAVFFTNVLAEDISQTYIQFDYTFDIPDQELWLTLQTHEGSDPVIILVSHPIINNVEWPKIQSPQYSLFQKNSRYQTVENFLLNIPPESIIVADPSLIYQGQLFDKPEQTIALSAQSEIETIDYILTTYHASVQNESYQTFSAVVDASNGEIIECREDDLDCHPRLMWKLDMPTVSSQNLLYLDNIQIDYTQDKNEKTNSPISQG